MARVVSTNYFEGDIDGYAFTGADGVSLTYKNNAIYRAPSLSGLGTGAAVDGGENIDQHLNVNSQLSNVGTDILTMEYEDFLPLETSIAPNGLRETGAADLGLSIDLFNIVRPQGANFDIGATEYPVPTPPAPTPTRGRIFGTGRTISLSHNTLYDRSKG